MGNSYASPRLQSNQAHKLADGVEDPLIIARSLSQRAHGQVARLPGAARKMPPLQQPIPQHTLVDAAAAGVLDGAPKAPTRLAKAQVPAMNFGGAVRGGSFVSGAGLGLDQALTTRPFGHNGPGSLQQAGPQQQQQQQVEQPPLQSGQASAQTSQQAQQQQQQQQKAQSQSTVVETGPITPAQALKRYSEYLTPFEQSEILQYPQVWFLGKADVQKIRGNPHLAKTNYGYDDDRGDYVVTVHDHIGYRYEVLGVLGKGSFGQVLKVLDYRTGAYRALKIIRNKKRFHHQAQVELRVLEHLRSHDPEDAHNVIHIGEHFMFRSHLCITFEMLSINLYEFIKQNNFVGLSLSLVRRFASQMLTSLRFMRRHRLIHCDLKPENILLRSQHRSAIKIIDFGSSCFVDERVYTYIQSRFYRSPEVILGLPYGCEIDMWSFGCILAELLTGYPLFPGEDEHEQLLCIMEVMGLPPRHLVDTASRRKMFFDSNGAPRIQPNSRGKVRNPATKTLFGVLRCSDALFLDLMESCLRWDPAERITPEQALQHPWFVEHAAQQAAAQQAAAQQAAHHAAMQQQTAALRTVAAAKPAAQAAGSAQGSSTGHSPAYALQQGIAAVAAAAAGAFQQAGAGTDGGWGSSSGGTSGAGATAPAQPMAIDTHTPRGPGGAGAPATAFAAPISNDTVLTGADCTPRSAGLPPIRGNAASTSGFTPRAMETDGGGNGQPSARDTRRTGWEQQQQQMEGLDATSPKRAPDQVPAAVVPGGATAAAKAIAAHFDHTAAADAETGLVVTGPPAFVKPVALDPAATLAALQQPNHHNQQQQHGEAARVAGVFERFLPHLGRRR